MTHVVGLRLHNFQCFRGMHELDLGSGVYAVTAEAADNAERSNYLGKSALLSAVRYALEGHKPKDFDSLDSLISHGEPEMGVDIELSDGTFVSRTKKRGSSTQLKVVIQQAYQEPDGNVVNDELELFGDAGEARVWALLGLSADDLEMTAYAEQGQLAALVSPASKIDLGAVVNGWLNLGLLEAAADNAGVELRSLVTKLRAAETALASDPELSVDPLIREVNHKALEKNVEELRAQVDDHAKRTAANAELLRRRSTWEQTRDRKRTAVVQLVEVLALWAGVLGTPRPVGDAAELEQTAIDAARRVDVAEAAHGQKRRLAAGKFDGACPVNGEQCPVATKINGQREKNAALVANSEIELRRVQLLAREADAPLLDFRQANRALQSALARFGDSRTRLTAYASALEAPMQPEPDVSTVVEMRSPTSELTELLAELQTSRESAVKQRDLEERFALLKQQVAAARAGFAVLGPEGAQRRCAERAVLEVERTANADLAKAGIDLTTRFAWGRETQVPATQCSQCGAAFPRSTAIKKCEGCLAPRGLKIDPKPRFVLSRVSGAAKDLVGLAVRCAAFKWLRNRRGASWSVAVLDEPFGALDRYHRRALSAHVQSLLASTFEQAFIVAHDQQVLDSMPKRIVIRGDGKWSTVRVA